MRQACLDAGFLVGREHEVTAAQGRAFPTAFVEVEHTAGLGGELWIAGKNPASISPGTNRVAAEPAPECGAADLSHDAFGHNLPLDLGEREPRQRQSEPVREFASERLNLDDDAGGKSGPGAPPRRLFLESGETEFVRNRFRHLLTIWRGVSRRDPMTSFCRPSAAMSTIFARMTSRYGDVYLRALLSSSRRCSVDNLIAYGLLLGMRPTTSAAEEDTKSQPQSHAQNTSLYL